MNALSVFGGNYYGASKTVTVPVGNGFIFLSLTYSESSQMGIIVVDKNKEVKEIKNHPHSSWDASVTINSNGDAVVETGSYYGWILKV